MGPNLKRLFDRANRKTAVPIDMAYAAEHRLKGLLTSHGEALVKVLELAIDCLDPTTDPVFSIPIIRKGKDLLATLEREAES